MIFDILLGTPLWVFALLTVLIWLGLCQLQASAVPICRIWRTPVLFIVWGMLGIILRNGGPDTGFPTWLITAAIGLLIGAARRNTLIIDHARGVVMRPGSILPLIRNLVIFGAHYTLNVAAALHPSRHEFLIFDIAVSGAFAGYFAGWLLRFVRHLRDSSGQGSGPGPRPDSPVPSSRRTASV
jgi:hypothetical protein